VRNDSRERHSIELRSRKTRQENKAFTIGYDGNDVWITPNLAAYSGNPRFYNGLQFYFFSMPFVFADPGVNVTELGERTVAGQAYDVVRITFGDAVGDSPNDPYLAHFDPSTHLLKLLLYTVTFDTGTPGTNFNARVYEDWQEVQGLMVPRQIGAYQWEEDGERLGELRGISRFENVEFTSEAPNAALFERPETASIAPAPPTNR
jgi:hypothetical protein